MNTIVNAGVSAGLFEGLNPGTFGMVNGVWH